MGLEFLTTIYPMTPLIVTGILLTSAGIYGVRSTAYKAPYATLLDGHPRLKLLSSSLTT